MATRSNADLALKQAMAMLIQNQASFVAASLAIDRKIDENVAAIRRELDEIKSILLRHERILNHLPEAIREKIGFKTR